MSELHTRISSLEHTDFVEIVKELRKIDQGLSSKFIETFESKTGIDYDKDLSGVQKNYLTEIIKTETVNRFIAE